jgi:hypothetical protein
MEGEGKGYGIGSEKLLEEITFNINVLDLMI